MEEKIAYAKRNRDDYNEQRKIAVDDLKGTWHHNWGLLPNTIYVINPDGKVIYRADWSFAHNVDRVLSNRDKIDTNEHIAHLGTPPWVFVPVTLKGGWIALYDILKAMPKIFYNHLKVDLQSWRNKRKNKTAAAAE